MYIRDRQAVYVRVPHSELSHCPYAELDKVAHSVPEPVADCYVDQMRKRWHLLERVASETDLGALCYPLGYQRRPSLITCGGNHLIFR